MRSVSVLPLALCLFAGAALADRPPIDCSRIPIAVALKHANRGPIAFTGVCSGPIVIESDRVSLIGVGTAVIDGGGGNAVTIAGVSDVSLRNIEVRNGAIGILGSNGAHFSLTNVQVHDNQLFGISLQTASSALLSAVSVSQNGLHGLDLQTGSAATISGMFASFANRVFGVNVNGSSLTFSQSNASMSGNAVGMQVATGANAFIDDPSTALDFSNNFATGLTIVSGAHMVSFGGTINASGNPVNGVSLNSKAGLDLDAGATLDCGSNGDGVQIQQDSELTVFNIPQFSGVSAFSTVNSHDNSGNGIVVKDASNLRASNQAQVISTGNGADGLAADDGSGIVLVNSNLTSNTDQDIRLSFGSRADLQTSTFATLTCDESVLVRGASGVNCPQ